MDSFSFLVVSVRVCSTVTETLTVSVFFTILAFVRVTGTVAVNDSVFKVVTVSRIVIVVGTVFTLRQVVVEIDTNVWVDSTVSVNVLPFLTRVCVSVTMDWTVTGTRLVCVSVLRFNLTTVDRTVSERVTVTGFFTTRRLVNDSVVVRVTGDIVFFFRHVVVSVVIKVDGVVSVSRHFLTIVAVVVSNSVTGTWTESVIVLTRTRIFVFVDVSVNVLSRRFLTVDRLTVVSVSVSVRVNSFFFSLVAVTVVGDTVVLHFVDTTVVSTVTDRNSVVVTREMRFRSFV